MVADLREMQENQWFSENRKDKLEFISLLYTDTHPEFEYTHEYVRR